MMGRPRGDASRRNHLVASHRMTYTRPALDREWCDKEF